MTLLPFIFDFCPTYLKGNGSPVTLLGTPLGTGTMLDYLCSCITSVSHETPVVLSFSSPFENYEQCIRKAVKSCEVEVSTEGIGPYFDRCEPSDWLILIDPRFFPVNGYHLTKFVRDLAVNPCARHIVAVESVPGGTKEYVLANTGGNVCKIQRFYEGVTWVRTSSVSCTIVCAASAELIKQSTPGSLSEFRQALAEAGVPGVDILPSHGYVDLTQEANLLCLMERFLVQKKTWTFPYTRSGMGRDVLVGTHCDIHRTVRMMGPVIVQNGVRIEADTTIIGPAVVGENACIQRGATIAQCLVMQDITVPAGTTTRHRVITSDSLSCFLKNEDSALTEVQRYSIGPGLLVGNIGNLSTHGGRRVYPVVKRVADVVLSGLGLVFLLPFLIFIAILVKVTSKGPILFGHERECRGGRIFRCWKFRTMVKDAHARQRKLYSRNQMDGPQFKLDDDPRIMRLGKWLRKTNIDELPQLINVLLGQMSLIGPRPSPFRENQICVPWRKARLSVRPGITGLWQVCRHDRSEGDFHQWIYYDMLYVRYMSLGLDIKIMLATVLTLGGRWSVPHRWLISERKLHDETPVKPMTVWSPLLRMIDQK